MGCLKLSYYETKGYHLRIVSGKNSTVRKSDAGVKVYKFNGKELDEETGLYYYGARYLDPKTSLWLSSDPLREKYADISSYAYCKNNPVMYVDPNGMDWYKNNKTGNAQWFDGSDKHKGYKWMAKDGDERFGGKDLYPVVVISKKPRNYPDQRAVKDNTYVSKPCIPNLPNLGKQDNVLKTLNVLSNVADHGEFLTQLSSNSKLSNNFGKAGNVLTGATVAYQLYNGDNKGAAMTVAEFAISKITPYYYPYKVGETVMTSEFTMSQAYYGALESKLHAIDMAHNVYQDPNSSGYKYWIGVANQCQIIMENLERQRINQIKEQDKY